MNFTNDELHAYLMRHVRRVDKDMKRKAYGNKRKKLFNINDIEFKIKDYSEYNNRLGQYDKDNCIIYVHSKFFADKKSLHRLDEKILDVVGHELTHHYVYENLRDNLRFECDSSPIFLSYLTWFGYTSGHYCYEKFKISDLYKQVKKIDDFNVLEDLMFKLWIDYKKAVKNIEKESKGNPLVENIFTFGTGKEVGLIKERIFLTDTVDRLSESYICMINEFAIGSNVAPNDIERLYKRKKLSMNARKTDRMILEKYDDDDFMSQLSLKYKSVKKVVKFKLDRENNVHRIMDMLFEGYCYTHEIEEVKNSFLVESFRFKEEDGDNEVWKLKLYDTKDIYEIHVEEEYAE